MDGGALETAYRAGRAAWPELALERERFASFARERAEGWQGAVDRGPDLFLACACVERVPGASEVFVGRFAPKLAAWLGRHGDRRELVDEVRQILIERCLLGERPAIASYSGRGSLEGWIRATATREALAIVRREGRNTEADEGALAQGVLATDEELAALKRTYRSPVLRAFEVAGAALSSSHRSLLRLHYVHGMTTASLATMYGVGRATLVRRLTEAREALVDGVRAELARTDGVHGDDVEAILRLVRSQVDLRLSLVLADSAREAHVASPGEPPPD